METFFVISDASIMFSHKVIFPVDNNIKKFRNICNKMKIEVSTCRPYNVIQILRVKRTWNLNSDFHQDWEYLMFLQKWLEKLFLDF